MGSKNQSCNFEYYDKVKSQIKLIHNYNPKNVTARKGWYRKI